MGEEMIKYLADTLEGELDTLSPYLSYGDVMRLSACGGFYWRKYFNFRFIYMQTVVRRSASRSHTASLRLVRLSKAIHRRYHTYYDNENKPYMHNIKEGAVEGFRIAMEDNIARFANSLTDLIEKEAKLVYCYNNFLRKRCDSALQESMNEPRAKRGRLIEMNPYIDLTMNELSNTPPIITYVSDTSDSDE